MIWVAATLIAAVAQTGRNAAQAGLTARVGTTGATAVRFVFGLLRFADQTPKTR